MACLQGSKIWSGALAAYRVQVKWTNCFTSNCCCSAGYISLLSYELRIQMAVFSAFLCIYAVLLRIHIHFLFPYWIGNNFMESSFSVVSSEDCNWRLKLRNFLLLIGVEIYGTVIVFGRNFFFSSRRQDYLLSFLIVPIS